MSNDLSDFVFGLNTKSGSIGRIVGMTISDIANRPVFGIVVAVTETACDLSVAGEGRTIENVLFEGTPPKADDFVLAFFQAGSWHAATF